MIKGKFIDNLPKVYGIYTGGFIGFIILMAIGEQMGMTAKAIGVALTQLENFDDAISSYDKAIEVSPGYADAWYNKAELLKHKGQEAEAETCFAKVKELEGE